MNRLRPGHLTAMLLLPAAAAWTADLPIPGTTVALPMPAGWRTVPAPGTALTCEAPDRSARCAVVLQPLVGDEGPAGFAQRNLADLQRVLVGMELRDWSFDQPLGGRSWSHLRYTYRIGPASYLADLWTTTEDAHGICICLSTTADRPDEELRGRFTADLTGTRPRLER